MVQIRLSAFHHMLLWLHLVFLQMTKELKTYQTPRIESLTTLLWCKLTLTLALTRNWWTKTAITREWWVPQRRTRSTFLSQSFLQIENTTWGALWLQIQNCHPRWMCRKMGLKSRIRGLALGTFKWTQLKEAPHRRGTWTWAMATSLAVELRRFNRTTFLSPSEIVTCCHQETASWGSTWSSTARDTSRKRKNLTSCS